MHEPSEDMEVASRTGRWRAVGCSVIGESHTRDGKDNQDALYVNPFSAFSPPGAAVVAVADGHGDARCFRSKLGAKFAVQAAADSLFACEVAFASDSSESERSAAVSDLPRSIVSRWRTAVRQHFKQSPFVEDGNASSKSLSGCADGLGGSPGENDSIFTAYGSTLIAALATPSFLVCLQIGDGVMLMARNSGVVEYPLPDDPNNFGTATTSLCDVDGQSRFRVRVIPLASDCPKLLLLCTDGYEKAFQPEHLPVLCAEYVPEFEQPRGWHRVASYLGQSLAEASRYGSGDDATAAFLFWEPHHIDSAMPAACSAACEPTRLRHEGLASEPEQATSCNDGLSGDGPRGDGATR